MKEPVLSNLEVCLRPKEIYATGLHDKRMSCFVEVVIYLFTTYGTNDIIAHVIKELQSYKQAPGLSAAVCAKSSYNKVLCCGIFYREKKFMSLFVKEFNETG